MSDSANQPPSLPPASVFTGPVAELIAQRMLLPPSRPGLLAAVDHFEILRVLGGGGMGIVLLARDTKTGREVAVKMVKTDLVTNLNVVHRFFREAGHLKRLQHTNIIPVQEISEKVEIPYFVMPYLEKGNLANRLKPGLPLDPGTILEIAPQVAEGLSFAHRSGIIHRDLKPANILLGANDHVCLADFGLARTLFNDTIADVGNRQLEGTAPYMSPAVAAGDVEDTRCDIYSFGALLYEMLTGHPPYKGRGTKEILDQIIAGPPKSIDSLNPRADRGLVAVAEKAMARELRDRYADMRDILKDLERIKGGQPPVGQHTRTRQVLKYLAILGAVAGVFCLGWLLIRRPVRTITVPISTAPLVANSNNNSVATPAVANPVITNPVVSPVISPDTTPVANPPTPILKIDTLAGQPGVGGHADGDGIQAQFSLPNNLALDKAGNIYVADTANNTIRKISPTGGVTTLAGLAGVHGTNDGIGNQARFWAPFGIAVDGAGNIYVADTANNIIRKLTPDGSVTTLAGIAGFPGNQDGLGSIARFRNPWSVAVDSTENVLIADMSNNSIRKITPAGLVSTVAGLGGLSGNTDGSASIARFNHPFAVTVDTVGNIYVSDTANNTIRKIAPNGTVSTLAGLSGYAGNMDGDGDSARFSAPQGLATDAAGNIYVADTGNNIIRKITPSGAVTTLTPPVLATPDKSGKNTPLNGPDGIAVDNTGTFFVADTGNHCIRKMAFSSAGH